MDHGFYHPDRGYWQTIGQPPRHIIDTYPAGTLEVPLRPGPDHMWDEGTAAWIAQPPAPPAPVQVKAEAQRRILALLPEWKQRTLTARAVTLAEKGRANWTAGELAEWEAGEALWNRITAIRAASDILEATVPIPQDFADDSHWPAQG